MIHFDKLHPYDKPGAIYSIECKNPWKPLCRRNGRAVKKRLYEHRVIPHKDAKRSHSLGDDDVTPFRSHKERGEVREAFKGRTIKQCTLEWVSCLQLEIR